MGWERGKYYTRSRRCNGRVVREYVGGGEIGRLAAELDAQRRTEVQAERAALAESKAQWDSAERATVDLTDGLRALVCAKLIEAGFHRHKRGEWRRRRVRISE